MIKLPYTTKGALPVPRQQGILQGLVAQATALANVGALVSRIVLFFLFFFFFLGGGGADETIIIIRNPPNRP